MRAGRGAAVAGALAAAVASGCTDLLSDPVAWASIEVETTRFSGEPVPGVGLTLFRYDRTQDMALSDATGFHRFRFIRPKDAYGVWANPPDGYIRREDVLGFGPSTAVVSGIYLMEGSVERVSFSYLKIGPGSIAVTLAEPDGSPIASVLVEVYDPFEVVASGVTDAEGAVTFHGIPFGNKGVRAFPPPAYLDGPDPAVYQHGIVVDEGVTAEVEFTLDRCEGAIRAEVLDHLGGPVEGAMLDLHSAQGFVTSGRTSMDGTFTFTGVACRRTHRVDLFPPYPYAAEPGPGTSYVDGLVVEGAQEVAIGFRLEEPCTGAIRVTAVDEDGTPVPGAAVDLYTATEFVDGGSTDASGALVFADVMCTVGHGVRISPPSGYSVEDGPGSSYFDGLNVAEGEELDVTFTLRPG